MKNNEFIEFASEIELEIYKLTKNHLNKKFKEIYTALNMLIDDKEINDAQKAREPIGFKTKSK